MKQNYNKIIFKSDKLMIKMNKEKDQLCYKIKILIREVNNKVLAVNWYKKKYKNTQVEIYKNAIVKTLN